jgi:hypothetical protein
MMRTVAVETDTHCHSEEELIIGKGGGVTSIKIVYICPCCQNEAFLLEYYVFLR